MRAYDDRRIIFLLWLAMLALCVFFACIQPVWSRVDEAQHFHYIQYVIENGALPIEGETFISPEVVNVSLDAGQWGWKEAGVVSTPSRLDPAGWIGVPEGMEDQDREKWVRRNLWYFNYESMQPPLYYLVNAPVYAAVSGGSLAKLYAMRLLAALMASAMVPITWLFAREALPGGSRLVTLGAPVVVLLTQGYALNMSQVSNDVLAVPLAAASLLMLLRIIGRGLGWKQSILAGTLIGASLQSKLTTIFLLPVVLLALGMLVVYRREIWSRTLAHAAIIFGTVTLTLIPWLLRNLVVYGDATGAAAARPLMSSFFRSPTISIETLRLEELLPTYWFGEPVFPFPFWTFAWVAVASFMAMAVLGLAFYFTRAREDGDARLRVMFVTLAFILGLAANLLLPFGSGIGGVPGRYLYPLMPAAAFLLMFGIERLLRHDRARFVTEIMLVWLIVWESLNLLAYIQNR